MLGEDGDFVPCLHSVGHAADAMAPQDVPWPCNADNKYIVHFPETREIWSFGSGYGGNALLGKKCFALRIASVMARDEGWMAEHMLILKLTSPEGEVKYIAGAFPSACGKTNLSMMIPTLPEWKVETIGDDIAWMKFGAGRPAVCRQPRGRLLRRRARDRRANEPQRDRHGQHATPIFTNCAKTDDGDIWWEGLTGSRPRTPIDWRGNDWTPESDTPAAHPERTLHGAGCAVPVDRARVGGPGGVPIDGDPVRRPPRDRRAAGPRGARLAARRVPRLDHVLGDDRGGRPAQVGKLRFDPMAMLPFCGYHMGDYFAHWLKIGERDGAQAARRSSTSTGSARTRTASSCGPASARTPACWPGSSVACTGDGRGAGDARSASCRRSGGGIDTDGPRRLRGDDARLLEVDADGWAAQLPQIKEHYAEFGDKLPAELRSAARGA